MFDKSFDEIVASYSELSPIEKAFKYIYENSIDYNTVTRDKNVSAILSGNERDAMILNTIFTNLYHENVLYESQMFSPNENILGRIHSRYHPNIPHSHDFFEIQYVLQGSFEQNIKDVKFTLTEGDFCFISPSVKHMLYTYSDDIIVLNLLIKHEYFPKAFKFLSISTDLISAFFMNKLYSQDNKPFLINHL